MVSSFSNVKLWGGGLEGFGSWNGQWTYPGLFIVYEHTVELPSICHPAGVVHPLIVLVSGSDEDEVFLEDVA